MQFFYTVRQGDTLSAISKRWGLPITSVIAANNLQNPNKIMVGEQLSIPPGNNKYRVKSGDSVYQIAQLYGVKISMIIEANALEPPYILQENQRLIIPFGAPYYVVQEGDTLKQIAVRFNVITEGNKGVELLQKANKLDTTDINPGMKLTVPYAPISVNGIIAYTASQNEQFDIWIYNLENGQKRQMTTGLGETFSIPTWSPDSSKIAFVGKNRVIYVIYLATNEIGAIDQLEEGEDFFLSWSPTSEIIAYSTRGIIQLDNTTLHKTSKIVQQGASYVNWFPNGTELLYQSLDASGLSQLYRYETTNQTTRQITNNQEGPLQNVRLSPDGKFVLYTTPGASISIIHTIELSTGNVYEVKGGRQSKNYYPTWSPDSLLIAFSATELEDNEYFSEIRTVERKGENERIWSVSNCFSTPVTWSSNGGKIAYLSGCEEKEYAKQIWIIDLKHPVSVKLVESEAIVSIQWSPESSPVIIKEDFTSETFGVSFQYPASWEKVNDERYEGDNGYFQISAIFGSENMTDVCHDEAFHRLMPYGSAPIITESANPYEKTCTIMPSSDQPVDMRNKAAFIAKYPSPILINQTPYNYFILWADKDHINEIASTVLFSP